MDKTSADLINKKNWIGLAVWIGLGLVSTVWGTYQFALYQGRQDLKAEQDGRRADNVRLTAKIDSLTGTIILEKTIKIKEQDEMIKRFNEASAEYHRGNSKVSSKVETAETRVNVLDKKTKRNKREIDQIDALSN